MSIEIIDILKPKNGLSFKLVEDVDIAVQGYESLADAVSHFVTLEGIQQIINAALSGKQDKLSEAQMNAVNSGITAQLVTQIGTNTTAIAGKADAADLTALAAVVDDKADASDLTTATTSLQNQINNIVSGSTSDSEVINARVGDDGTSYATLKARLDAENEKTTKNISTINKVVKTNELYDESENITGGLYLAASGEWYENPNYWSTGLIPVNGGDTIYVTANNIDAGGVQWCGFKANGTTYASQGAVATSSDGIHLNFTTSTGGEIAYVRLGFKTLTHTDNVSISTTATLNVWVEQSSVLGLSSALSGIDTEIGDINDLMYQSETKTLNDLDWTSGYIDVSGAIQSNANFVYSEAVTVSAGDHVIYELWNANNITCAIAAYNTSNNYVSASSVFYDSGESTGSLVAFTGEYVVPANITKLIFTRSSYQSKVSHLVIPKQTLRTDLLSDRLDTTEAEIAEIESELEDIGVSNRWKDKIWVCFGTSLTDNWSENAHIGETDEPTGKYPPYLREMGEFAEFPSPHTTQPDATKSNNLGIAGGKINGHILYYIRYYLHDNPSGTEIANTANLITIEGAVNDFAASIPLGTVGDTIPYTDTLLTDGTSNGSFAGACYCAFTEAMRYAPNATVVLLTETTGKQVPGVVDYSWGRTNNLGLKQVDYINMTKAVADYVGIPIIDCGRDSMINAANPNYLADWIHHSYLGGKQYASVIWEKLKNIPCKILSVQ